MKSGDCTVTTLPRQLHYIFFQKIKEEKTGLNNAHETPSKKRHYRLSPPQEHETPQNSSIFSNILFHHRPPHFSHIFHIFSTEHTTPPPHSGGPSLFPLSSKKAMWTPGADVGGGGSSMTFDDRPVGKSAGGGGGRPQSTGFGGGGGGGGGGGFRGGQPQQSFGGGGGGFRGEQPQSFGANDFGSSFGGASTASISTAGGSKMKKLTVADNFYKRMQDAPGHKAAKKKAPPKSSNAGGMPRRPNFLTCYLCGMQFGKSSLPIHQPQCYYKKLIVWEREDTTIRGPKPIHPDEMGAGMTGGCAGSGAGMNEDQIEEFNNQQYQHYSDNMVSCENCGRTFMPDRLQVHMRSCKPGASGRGSKPVAGKVRPNMQAEDEYELPAHSSARPASPGPRRSASPKPAPAAGLEPCPQCGRRFVAKKIEAHLAICKGPSPSGPNGPRTGYDGNPLPTFEDSLVPCEYVPFFDSVQYITTLTS